MLLCDGTGSGIFFAAWRWLYDYYAAVWGFSFPVWRWHQTQALFMKDKKNLHTFVCLSLSSLHSLLVFLDWHVRREATFENFTRIFFVRWLHLHLFIYYSREREFWIPFSNPPRQEDRQSWQGGGRKEGSKLALLIS